MLVDLAALGGRSSAGLASLGSLGCAAWRALVGLVGGPLGFWGLVLWRF